MNKIPRLVFRKDLGISQYCDLVALCEALNITIPESDRVPLHKGFVVTCADLRYNPARFGSEKEAKTFSEFLRLIRAYYAPKLDQSKAEVIQAVVDGKVPSTDQGMKFDDGKIDMRLLTRDLAKPLFMVATVLTYGKLKYEESGWKSVEPKRYESALDRHLTAWRTGEQCDPETGIHHLAHVACNVLFLLWVEVKSHSLDHIGKFNTPPERK